MTSMSALRPHCKACVFFPLSSLTAFLRPLKSSELDILPLPRDLANTRVFKKSQDGNIKFLPRIFFFCLILL